LIQESLYRWLAPCFAANAAEVCARLSRLLLLLVAVELLTMPLTQHLWTWDGFLHGGQDFEFGLFMIVICLCLALLRAQHSRQRVRLLLALRQRLGRILSGWQQFLLAAGWTAVREPSFYRSHEHAATPLLI
jgi:hypothetical protein